MIYWQSNTQLGPLLIKQKQRARDIYHSLIEFNCNARNALTRLSVDVVVDIFGHRNQP